MTEKFYDAEAYWGQRFDKSGLSIRGPGDWGLSEKKNEIMYEKAKRVFLNLCKQEGIDLTKSRVLEVGTGNGFYANVLREANVGEYLGTDITDILFNKIQATVPGMKFVKLDITQGSPPGEFDLVIVLDVTQHITSDELFSNAMQNIRDCLVPGGFIIIAALLKDLGQLTFHQRYRGMGAFQKEFPHDKIGSPIPYRDKFIFPIQKEI